MATAIIMPRQGQSVESCIIGQWHKKVGDPVKVGDPLFTYETDKATFDEQAKVDGTMLAIFFAEGDDVPCLTNVCVIGQPGESTAEFNPESSTAQPVATAAPAAPAPAAPAAPVSAPVTASAVKSAGGPSGTPVIMPRQGQSVESCIIGQWHKKVGDPVAVGDALFTYETDKATFDEQAKVSGTMLAIFFAAGDDVPCLTNVCVIGQPGDSYAEFDPNGGTAAAVETAAPVAAPVPVAAAPATAASAPTAVSGVMPEKISPRARALAERSGADLRQASASGPQGRVITRDVEALIAGGKLSTSAVGAGFEAGLAGTAIGGRVGVADLSAKAAPAASAAPVAAPQPAQQGGDENGTFPTHADLSRYSAAAIRNIRSKLNP